MKKFQIVVIVLFSIVSNISAQNGVKAIFSATFGTKNSVSLQVGYQYKSLDFYTEYSYGRDIINNMSSSIRAIKVGADYTVYTAGKIDFTAGAFAGYGAYKGDEADLKFAYSKLYTAADALILGVRFGANVNVGSRMFVKAALEVTSTDFDRMMEFERGMGTRGLYDAGLTVGFGVRF